jgi:hypothetical protein
MHDEYWQLKFWRNVNKDDPASCWIWRGKPNTLGYGTLRWVGFNDEKTKMAHRMAYEITHGEIPDGLVIDHECHNAASECRLDTKCPHRLCCNPAHLAAKTRGDNVQAGRSGTRNKTHCPRNHAYTPENTRWVNTRGTKARQCRTCAREKTALRRATEGRRDYE